MRFCPFCAQDNPDDSRECVHCGKRLPALRAGAARPTATAPKAAAPRPAPRPAPPRPAPRAPSTRGPEAFAPTAAPGTLPPLVKQPNGPSKAAPGDATLKPLASVAPPHAAPVGDDEATREHVSPTSHPVTAPTGTLLGIPTVPTGEIPTTVQPAPESEKDSGRRTTQPLSVQKVAREARKPTAFDDDAATQVQNDAPDTVVDDGPTSRTPLVEPPTKLTPSPAPARKPTPAAGVPGRKPTPAAGVPGRKPTPAGGIAARPPMAPPQPKPRTAPLPTPEPLPPPPMSAIPTRQTAMPGVSNDAGAFPQLDVGPTPAIPVLALPPMPPSPSGSIVDAVKYLLPLAKAIWARKKAQDAIRTLLHGDQRLLDSVLRDLGRVAREEEIDAPALADEMHRVKEQEERRLAAETRVADAEAGQKREEERWRIDQGERQADLARREAEIKSTDEELRHKAEERRTHEAERAKVDAQIRAAEKRAAAADAKAQKAEVTPPEKGGGPNTAANARAEAAEARKEATALIPARDAAKAEVEKLDGPIQTLTQQLTDGRAALQQKRKELTEAKVAHERALEELQAQREQAAAERDAAERELTQRFVSAGTILNLNRVEHPKLAPLYGRVDELKNGVNAREAAIVRLESERRLYDRGAVQKGLIAVGSAFGVVVILAIVLMVLVAR